MEGGNEEGRNGIAMEEEVQKERVEYGDVYKEDRMMEENEAGEGT